MPKQYHHKGELWDEKKFIPYLNYPKYTESIGSNIFQTTDDDDKQGLSVEDRAFLAIMENNIYRNETGQWVAPLPFREPRPILGDNRHMAGRRANLLDLNLKKNPKKCEHAVAFMKRIFDAGHAELAPPLKDKEEFWYLPIFSVYHSKKPDQIRMVFDSSAQYDGLSLNNVLLTRPDLTNSLLGVLLRFRLEKIGIMADIQQMFHCFQVCEDHRNYLRFLWYADNDPKEQLVEYRMRVHVFGNSSSSAVAIYGLRRTANNAEQEFGSDVKTFVERNFYVDDGLISLPSADEVVSLMKRTQQALLQEGGLRLHKIVSNSSEVMKCFPTEDLAKNLMSLDLSKDCLPSQRTLGISWDLPSDSFTFNLSSDEKPYTRRGVLSCLNSFYDPLGFVTPVLIKGKLLLRKLTSESTDWDLPLSDGYQEEWELWRQQLHHLKDLKIPRCYFDVSTKDWTEKTLHVFTDASEEAIAAVAFLRAKDKNANYHHGFILGKGKDGPIQQFLLDNRTVWIFNPPHSSHMSGAWERMIGLMRRIFDSLLMDGSARKLTHETLVTFLAEASAIINSRPLVPVSTDPEYPFILTPYTLITQKTDKGGGPFGTFDEKNKAQWKRVQQLADIFWKRWKTEYLVLLQSRRKWITPQRNLSVGDVVLMKDNSTNRCDWRLSVVERVFASETDNKVRKVELRVNKDGVNTYYTRPVTEIVLIIPV